MELTELQALWLQHDKNLSENTRINKEILRQILISKPEKRINREKIKAGINLVLQIVVILVVLVPNVHYRHTIDFYIGAIMFFGLFSLMYYWSVKYFMLLCKVDLTNSIICIKKEIKQLEKYKIKFQKFNYILSPFGIIGIFLLSNIHVISGNINIKSMLPFLLIILVFLASVYYTFKYSIFEHFRKLNKEIAEIEKLGKD